MTESIRVYEPVAPANDEQRCSRRELSTLRGKVIGFIDNTKPNFDYLADDLGELLVEKYGVARIVRRRKGNSGSAASEAIIQEIVRECDAVVTGSGD